MEIITPNNGDTSVGSHKSLELSTLSKPELQRATSTTNTVDSHFQLPLPSSISRNFNPLSDPVDWSVDDVMRYLISVDSALTIHTELFKKHVISLIIVFNIFSMLMNYFLSLFFRKLMVKLCCFLLQT
jgi:hypothetical protein